LKIAFFLGRIHHAIKLLPVALGLQEAGHTIEFVITDNSVNIDPTTDYLGKFGITEFHHAKDYLVQYGDPHEVDAIFDNALSIAQGAMSYVAPFWVISACYDAAMDLVGFGHYLDNSRPNIVFALHENNFFVKTLFYSAQERNIKTCSLMEGMILAREESTLKKYSTGTKYTDVLFSWSEYDKQYYADPDKIMPVGPSHFDDWINLKHEDTFESTKLKLKVQMGFRPDDEVIMFAPPRLDLYRGDPSKAIMAIVNWANLKRIGLILKLHPFQHGIEQVTEMVKQFDKVRVSNDADPMPLLVVADKLITQTSTIALEALVLGIPVYELDMDYFGIEQGLHKQGGAHLISGDNLDYIIDAPEISDDFIKNRLPLADGQSVKRIVDYIGATQWVK